MVPIIDESVPCKKFFKHVRGISLWPPRAWLCRYHHHHLFAASRVATIFQQLRNAHRHDINSTLALFKQNFSMISCFFSSSLFSRTKAHCSQDMHNNCQWQERLWPPVTHNKASWIQDYLMHWIFFNKILIEFNRFSNHS